MARGSLVYRQVNGKTVVSSRPRPSSKPPTEKQKAHKERFKAGAEYANSVKENAELSQIYHAGVKPGVGVYGVALADFIKAPVVEDVFIKKFKGEAGDVVGVYAYDDFAVTSLTVALLDENGKTIESGEARVVVENGSYEYDLQADLPADMPVYIKVTAKDRPGNAAVMVKMWRSGDKKLVDAELPVTEAPKKAVKASAAKPAGKKKTTKSTGKAKSKAKLGGKASSPKGKGG